MRVHVVAVAILCLAGCADVPAPPVPSASPVLHDLYGGVADLLVFDGLNFTLDAEFLLGEDTESIILVKAKEALTFRYTDEARVAYAFPFSPVGDRNDPNDVCISGALYHPAPGDDILAMLAGKPAGNQTWPRVAGGSGSSVSGSLGPSMGGGGSGGHSSAGNGGLAAGEYMLFSTALSGIPEGQLHDDDTWDITFEATAAFDVYVLPPLPFLCGIGFERWENTTANTNTAAVGGFVASHGYVGSSLGLRMFPTAGGTGGEITMVFDDERTPYTGGTVRRTALQNVPIGLENSHWNGLLIWRLQSSYNPFFEIEPTQTAITPTGVAMTWQV